MIVHILLKVPYKVGLRLELVHDNNTRRRKRKRALYMEKVGMCNGKAGAESQKLTNWGYSDIAISRSYAVARATSIMRPHISPRYVYFALLKVLRPKRIIKKARR